MPSYWRTPAGNVSRLCRDMLRQPHCLIAGTTGSGKSTAINSLIYTALYQCPEDVRFWLIDPKQTELYDFVALPHTVAYADTPAGGVALLRDALDVIGRRGRAAREAGRKQYSGSDAYIIIDELGDLIYSDRDTVPLLSRIAMIGRAAKVHLIAGTQCPNRKTLSAEFAANCTGRLALRCQSAIESRQILGSSEAVGLPKIGRGYYLTPETMTPQLVEIPYTPPEEIAARVDWWRRQA